MREFTFKEELAKYVRDNQKYRVLQNVEHDEEIDNLINELKEEYISICKCPNTGWNKDLRMMMEYQRHAQKSEVLGKLIMLAHEFQGFKGVQEILHELHWENQNLITLKIEEMEDRIKELEAKETGEIIEKL